MLIAMPGKSPPPPPGCSALDDSQIEQILLEVARRGIPTVRGLSGDDSGATGDLGLSSLSGSCRINFVLQATSIASCLYWLALLMMRLLQSSFLLTPSAAILRT